METNQISQNRNELFQKLKPPCVEISQLAIRESDSASAAPRLIKLTSHVLTLLNKQLTENPVVIDAKLAEYVFFPLYHIFRKVGDYPMSLVENCIKCLNILIRHGWKTSITPKLVQQILSLLTFIIDGSPGGESHKDVPEEITLEAFRSLTGLLSTAGTSAVTASGLSEADSMPILGHAITVMLDAAVDGATPAIQQEAIRAAQTTYTTLRDLEALANFLPGTISAFVKILSMPNRHKALVLSKCLKACQVVLTRVLTDVRMGTVIKKAELSNSDGHESSSTKNIITPSWLKATAAQIKLALSTIVKLRTHGSPEVQQNLRQLCISLLDECHTSLSNCATVLIETAIILDASSSEEPSTMETSLADLVSIYPELGETVKSIIYTWMSSLSRKMQSSDDSIKENAVLNVTRGIKVLISIGTESSTLDDTIADNLRDTIASLLTRSEPQSIEWNSAVQLLNQTSLPPDTMESTLFQPVLLHHQNEKRLRSNIFSLVSTIGFSWHQSNVIPNLLEYMRESSSLNQVAVFWLCFELVKANQMSMLDVSTFFDASALTGSPEDTDSALDDIYDFSLQVLDSHSEPDPPDWRLEAIAMEVTAYVAQKSCRSFRPELIDVLFPIAAFLGSDNSNLQQHAVTTLNSLAVSCEYASVSELIVSNVDYMVNSVALRLNTLDISPSSIQVLLMMIRLAGPRIIPFLDDVVESIFAALDNYHGYPLFIEILFSVLKEVVDQAAQPGVRLLTSRESKKHSHVKVNSAANNLDGLLEFLDKQKEYKIRELAENGEFEPINNHPKVPWVSKDKKAENNDDDSAPPPEEEKPPNSPTYKLLLRVSMLTQHYLTSPTPKLRRLLLELLTTSSQILAGDEDAYLPLVNAIWPVAVSRLYDSEPFIVIEACRMLSGMCEAAGDFLSSRFQTQWAEGLGIWCRKVQQQGSQQGERFKAAQNSSLPQQGNEIVIPLRMGDSLAAKTPMTVNLSSSPSSGSLGHHASQVKIWEAVVGLMTSIIRHVRIDDSMFDDTLDLLSEVMETDSNVREALEVINADAVWLHRYDRGLVEPVTPPQVDGITFVQMKTSVS